MAFARSDIRKILTEAGVPDENIETAVTKLATKHIEIVDSIKNEVESLEAKAKAAEKLKEQLASATTQLAELQEADYKAKYEAEKANSEKITKEYENYKTEQGKKAVRAAKEEAYKGILKDAGIPERHFAKILKYSDIDALELDEKGKPTKANDILKAVKEEWADHVEKTVEKGANMPNPPANNGKGEKAMTVDEIMAIKNTAERQAAIVANKELFGA